MIDLQSITRNLRKVICVAGGLLILVGAGCSPENKSSSEQKSADTKDQATVQKPSTPSAQSETPTPVAQANAPKPPAVPQTPRPDGGTMIQVDNANHNFGTIWIGDTLKHAFKLTNKGDKLLEITNVKPSCGCTVAGSYPKQLEPGQTGEFPFSLNSLKLHSGKFTKTVNISSSDPTKPTLKLTLTGVCRRYVEVEPRIANFGVVDGAEPHERVVKIRNNAKEPLKLEIQPITDKRITAELVETQAGEEFELHVKTVPPIDPGTLSAMVKIKANLETQKELAIRAYARIPKRIDVSPPTIMMTNTVKSGREQKRILRVNIYGAPPVKLLEATSDDPQFKLTIKELKAGKAYTVSFVAPANYELPKEGRTVVLKTDDAKYPEVKVPVRLSIARAPTKRPAKLMVGKPIPTFEQRTADNQLVKTADLSNHVTVLNFFAPNCPYCAKQLPRVEKLRPAYEAKGVRFINVSQTMHNKKFTDDEVKAKLKSLGVSSELIINPENNFGKLFSATSYPTMVVLGKSGKIEAVNIGNRSDLESRLKAQLTKLLAAN